MIITIFIIKTGHLSVIIIIPLNRLLFFFVLLTPLLCRHGVVCLWLLLHCFCYYYGHYYYIVLVIIIIILIIALSLFHSGAMSHKPHVHARRRGREGQGYYYYYCCCYYYDIINATQLMGIFRSSGSLARALGPFCASIRESMTSSFININNNNSMHE